MAGPGEEWPGPLADSLIPLSFWGCNGDWRSLKLAQASLVVQTAENLPAMQETWVRSLDQEDLPEKGTALHSSTLAWRTPWIEEPGGLRSMGSRKVRHDWATFISSILGCLAAHISKQGIAGSLGSVFWKCSLWLVCCHPEYSQYIWNRTAHPP